MSTHVSCVCNPMPSAAARKGLLKCVSRNHNRTRNLFCPICRGGDPSPPLPTNWRCQTCVDAGSSDSEDSGSDTDEDDYDFEYVIAGDTGPDGEPIFLIKWDDIKGISQLCSWEPDDSDGTEALSYQEFVGDTLPSTSPSHQEARDFSELVHRSQDGTYSVKGEDGLFPNTWRRSLDEGDWSFAQEITPEIMGISSHDWDQAELQGLVHSIASSVPRSLLEALTGSGLVRRRLFDTALNATVKNNLVASKNRPSIYAIEFVDCYGRPPTVDDMETINDAATSYLFGNGPDDAKLACEIDSVVEELTPAEVAQRYAGTRRYNADQSAAVSLLNSIRNRIGQNRANGRVDFILTYVGYSDHAKRRLNKQHKKHKGSNKLMCLFEAIAHCMLGGKYSAHGQVVFNCWQAKHAGMAEIFFCLLTDANSRKGLGFNISKPGGSVDSYRKYDEFKYDKWADEVGSIWADNQQLEKSRIDDALALKSEAEESERELLIQQLEAVAENSRLHQAVDVARRALADRERGSGD